MNTADLVIGGDHPFRGYVAVDRPARHWNSLPAWLLLFVGVHTLWFSWLMARGMSDFLVGDWLINYRAGFLRRGLTGEIALRLAHGTAVPPQYVVLGMQAAAFAVFLGCSWTLLRRVQWTPWMAAVVLSPAAFAFTVLDEYAGLRKEVLLFAALALFYWLLQSGAAWVTDAVLSAYLTLVLVGMILSHEALVVGAPYFVAGLLSRGIDGRRLLKICAVPALCGAVALAAIAGHAGDAGTAQRVCASLGYQLHTFTLHSNGLFDAHPNVCSGAIAWLSLPLAVQRQTFSEIVGGDHFVRTYALLAVLAFAPLVWAYAELWPRRKEIRGFNGAMGCVALGLIAMLGLCYTAMDWGRWIHVQMMCMTLLLLVQTAGLREVALRVRAGWQRYAVWAAVAVYATCWTLPSVIPAQQHGYITIAGGWVHTLHHLGDAR